MYRTMEDMQHKIHFFSEPSDLSDIWRPIFRVFIFNERKRRERRGGGGVRILQNMHVYMSFDKTD